MHAWIKPSLCRMTHHHYLLDFSSSSSSPFHHAETTPWPAPTHVPPYYTAPPTTTMPAMTQPLLLNSSRYSGPARELLAEICSLTDHAAWNPKGGGVDVEANYSASWEGSNPGALLSSMDLLALQRRKATLLSMVQEVDRRYRRYREQMRATELSFDAAAGAGAAQVYTRLAMRAMSRHFRSLRDALVGQLVRALTKAMGQGDTTGSLLAVVPGASRGDTPRLRVLDQCLRQQRAFQQSGGATESYPWRPQRGLPERAVAVLRSWLFEHFLHPYPNDVDKHILARQTGLSRSQVSNWFINARVRLWKPMIEEMYTEEETKEQGGGNGGGKTVPDDHHGNTGAAWAATRPITGEIPPHRLGGSSCFVSAAPIIPANDGQQLFHSYLSSNGGAVSLTLGLQQRQQQPAMMIMQQRSSSLMLGAGDQEEEEDVVLPYRNLMGSELLHDLADPIVYN